MRSFREGSPYPRPRRLAFRILASLAALAAMLGGGFARAQCGIQITAPTSGESLPAEECFTVTWSYQGACTGGIVQVYLWSDCHQQWFIQDTGPCAGGPPASAVAWPATSMTICVENLDAAGAKLEVRWVGNSSGQTLTSRTSSFTLVPEVQFHAACFAGQIGKNLCFHVTAPGWTGHTALVLASLTGATTMVPIAPNCTVDLDVDLFTFLVAGSPAQSLVMNLPCSATDPATTTQPFLVPNNPQLVGTPFWLTGFTWDPLLQVVSGCPLQTNAFQLF